MPQSRGDPILYDHDAEEALLGALLTDPEYLAELAWLQPSHFHSEHNALFFALFREHWKQYSGEIDATTLNLSLLNSGKLDAVGGSAHFAELASKAGIPELTKYYAEGLRLLAEKRKGLRRAGEMAKQALENPGTLGGVVRQAK